LETRLPCFVQVVVDSILDRQVLFLAVVGLVGIYRMREALLEVTGLGLGNLVIAGLGSEPVLLSTAAPYQLFRTVAAGV
jgi:hypothetical protein